MDQEHNGLVDMTFVCTDLQRYSGYLYMAMGVFTSGLGAVFLFSGSAASLCLLLFGFYCGLSGYRNTRLRVSATSRGLEVRNPVRHYSIPWNDIFEFQIVRRYAGLNSATTQGLPGSMLVAITLDRGAHATAMAATFLQGRERDAEQQARLVALETMRKRYTTREW